MENEDTHSYTANYLLGMAASKQVVHSILEEIVYSTSHKHKRLQWIFPAINTICL